MRATLRKVAADPTGAMRPDPLVRPGWVEDHAYHLDQRLHEVLREAGFTAASNPLSNSA